MRYLLLLASTASLSACSIFEQPPVHHGGYDLAQAGHYNAGYLQGYGVQEYGVPYSHLGQPSIQPCQAAYEPCAAQPVYGGQAASQALSIAVNDTQTLQVAPGVTCGAPQTYSAPQPFSQTYVPAPVAQGCGQEYAAAYSAGYGPQSFQGDALANGYDWYQGAQVVSPQVQPTLRGLSQPAGASQDHYYGNLGGVIYDIDAPSYGLQGRLGYHTGRIIGAEVEGSLGIKNDDILVSDGTNILTGSSGVDYNIAAFALARLPLTEALSVHARGGYDYREVGVSVSDGVTEVSDKATLDGIAYGLGAEYLFTPRDGVRIDYTRYENDVSDFDSVSASYVRRF